MASAFKPKKPWWTIIASLGKEGIDWVRQLLQYDPNTRLSAQKVSHAGSTVHLTCAGPPTSLLLHSASPDGATVPP